MKEDSDMDAYACEGSIDELLNGFIDDELAARQRTEVVRLMARDPKIQQRLAQLQKCRTLVGSLPCAEAPPQILQGVKASLAKPSAPRAQEEPAHYTGQRAGRVHLLGRRLLSAAAMIALVGILAAVIYTIVAPEHASHQPKLAVDHRGPSDIERPARVAETGAALAFSGRLELKTSALAEASAIVNRVIKENDLSDSIGDVREANRRIYYVRCSREGLNSLLGDLEGLWPNLDSAAMFMDTESYGRELTIDAVTTEQIIQIVDQDSYEERIELAKDLGVLNSMAQNMPGREILAAIAGDGPGLMAIPRPMITGGQLPNAKPTSETQAHKTIRLTIIISR
ncbi:MAG: anti-sigma factor family protein [Planctomycetota bacterium]|jgi:hypothetical protein